MENKTIVRATPAARFYAKEHNINLSEVRGSGPKGRIHKCDVEDYKLGSSVKVSPLAKRIAEIENVDLSAIKGTGANGKIMKEDVMAALGKVEEKAAPVQATQTTTASAQSGEIEVVPMTSMRKVIAKRMTESYLGAPTFLVNAEFDMTNIIALREQVQQSIIDETGVKSTVTDFISLAVIKALMKHPYLNASLTADGKEIHLHKYVNLAVAVGTDDGLLVPVINNADKMSLKELVVASKEIVAKTLDGKLTADEMAGSTFTISNLGMYGVDHFTAIINQPNSAILAISSTKKKPVVVDDEIVIRPMMSVALTLDHRVIDGLEGAKFMQTLRSNIENPLSLLI